MRFRSLAVPTRGPDPCPDYATPLGHGFDTWVETWNHELEEKFYNRLTAAQRDAQALDPVSGQGVTIEIGPEEFQVAPFGASGAKWRVYNRDLQIMFRSPKMDWSQTIRFSAEGLWQCGLEALQDRAERVMVAIGRPRDARHVAQVSRFDYAFDFYSPAFSGEFRPDIVRSFVCPSKVKWATYGERDQESIATETVRLGKFPGLQIEVYNKAREITAISGKDWFREVWEWDAPSRPGGEVNDVWRIECRFGAEYLKNRNLRSTSDVLHNLKNLLASALIDRRLTVGDETRVRNRAMHPLWYDAWQASGDARIAPATGRLASKRRDALTKIYGASVTGMLRGLSHLAVGTYDRGTVEEILSGMPDQIEDDPLHDKKCERAMERLADVLKPEA